MRPRSAQLLVKCLGSRRSLNLGRSYTTGSATAHGDSSTPVASDIYDVVCVGGGPAGLSLLAGLKASPITSGLKVALIEGQDLKKNTLQNASATSYSNRCSSLTPTSVRFLKDIGAWKYVDQSRVQPYHGMEVWDGITNSRITFDWAHTSSLIPSTSSSTSASSQTIAYMIENTNLTTALQTLLTNLGNTSIFSPTRVENISCGPSTPTLDLTSWPTVTLSDKRSLTARLLVGADGANSPVRTFAGIQSRGWDYGRLGVVATVRLAAEPSSRIAFQRFLPSGPVAMLPLPGNMASLVWSTMPERAVRLKSLKPADFCAMVNAGFRLTAVDLTYMHSLEEGQEKELEWREKHTRLEGPVPERVVEVQDGTVAAFPLKMRHADTYTGERVALVGDAAHTIHPLAGQGLNQGQGDVASLIRTIEAAVQCGHDIGSQLALEQYNFERYATNNALLGVCDKLHKLYSFESGPIVPLRSIGLRAVDQLTALKGFLMRRAAGGA